MTEPHPAWLVSPTFTGAKGEWRATHYAGTITLQRRIIGNNVWHDASRMSLLEYNAAVLALLEIGKMFQREFE